VTVKHDEQGKAPMVNSSPASSASKTSAGPTEAPLPDTSIGVGSTAAHPGRDEQARRYRNCKLAARLAAWLVTAGFLLLVLLMGLSLKYEGVLRAHLPQTIMVHGAYIFSLLFALALVGAPLSYYRGYHLEHVFQLSRQNLRAWMWDQTKDFLLSSAILLALGEVIYALIRVSPGYWWLWSAALTFLLLVLFTKIAPIALLPIFFSTRPLADESLLGRLRMLTQKAGLTLKEIMVVDFSAKTKTANAALMGLGKTRRIMLSDTLLEHFSEDEVEVVLAHELGHHHLGHFWKGLVLQGGMLVLGFYLVHLALNRLYPPLGFGAPHQIGTLPLLMLIFLALSTVLLPPVNLLLRRMEYNADDYALRLSGAPRHYISALEKLGRLNLAEMEPPTWLEFLLYSHPPLVKRIAHARRYSEERTG